MNSVKPKNSILVVFKKKAAELPDVVELAGTLLEIEEAINLVNKVMGFDLYTVSSKPGSVTDIKRIDVLKRSEEKPDLGGSNEPEKSAEPTVPLKLSFEPELTIFYDESGLNHAFGRGGQQSGKTPEEITVLFGEKIFDELDVRGQQKLKQTMAAVGGDAPDTGHP